MHSQPGRERHRRHLRGRSTSRAWCASGGCLGQLPAGTREQVSSRLGGCTRRLQMDRQHVGRWRGNPRRLAFAGEGAGGTLALHTVISTVAAGLTRPRTIIAIYPITQTGSATESYADSVDAKPLNKAMMAWFLHNTLSTQSDKTNHPGLDIIHPELINRARPLGLAPARLIPASLACRS